MKPDSTNKPRVLLAAVQVGHQDGDGRRFTDKPIALISKIGEASIAHRTFDKNSPLEIPTFHWAYVRLVIEEYNFQPKSSWAFTSTPEIPVDENAMGLFPGFDRQPSVQFRTDEPTVAEQLAELLLNGKDASQLNEMKQAFYSVSLWRLAKENVWHDRYSPEFNRRKTVSFFYPGKENFAYELSIRSGQEVIQLCVNFTK